MANRATLTLWLEVTREDHPVRRDLAIGLLDEELDDLDGLLAILEAAGPARLASKRRDFRRLSTGAQWADMRSELLVAAWLARKGVAFEFGEAGRPQPDLVLPDFSFGIEVTRRRRKGVWELQRTISRALYGVQPRPHPVVRLNGQPVAIREGKLTQIGAEIRGAVENGETRVHAVLRPATEGKPAVTAEIDLYAGRSSRPQMVYLPEAAELTVPMLDIEALVLSCLEDGQKSRQGASMPSVLMIDVTRLSPVLWLRSPTTWADRLAHLLGPEHTFVAVALVYASVESPRLAMGIGEKATDATRENMTRWGAQMGMGSTTTEQR